MLGPFMWLKFDLLVRDQMMMSKSHKEFRVFFSILKDVN